MLIKKICENADRRVKAAFEAGWNDGMATSNYLHIHVEDLRPVSEIRRKDFDRFKSEELAARQREIEEHQS